MKKIQLSSRKLIDLMSNRDNIIAKGSFGILLPFNNELLKIYYKKIFDGFYYLDESKLINEIEINKETDKEMMLMKKFYDYNAKLIENEKKFNVLESIDLVKASVFCNDYLIGFLLNYYRDYVLVGDIYKELSIRDKKDVLMKMEQYLLFLISNNIYPTDIKENNIMVRRDDLDIKFIDLDGDETIYEEIEYIESYQNIKKECIYQFKEMCRRLNNS